MTITNLKARSINAAYWTFGSYAVSQGLRFGSNLLLTRLLAPEFFGMMAIVTMFMVGLAMFSDIGIGTNIIQSERSKDQVFLDSAWTLQIIRGLILWIFCIIAAYPMSVFYNEPTLIWLIPVTGLSALISGFNSTSLFIANKNLTFKKISLLEFYSQIISVIITVAIAYFFHSIWALIIGSLFGVVLKTVMSHVWFENTRNKLHWDIEQFKYLMSFGGWIFLSTILSFFIGSSASLILGKFISMSQLGMFTIAVSLSKIVEQIYQQIDAKILLPLLSNIKHLNIFEMRKRIFKIKLAVIGAFLPMLWVLILFGQQIIDLIFDHRYHDAGWILSIYALSSVPMIVSALGPFYLASGNSKLYLNLNLIKGVIYFLAIYVGWYFGGPNGIIIGMALQTFITYIVEVIAQRQYSVWFPKIDIPALIVTLLVLLVSINFTHSLSL